MTKKRTFVLTNHGWFVKIHSEAELREWLNEIGKEEIRILERDMKHVEAEEYEYVANKAAEKLYFLAYTANVSSEWYLENYVKNHFEYMVKHAISKYGFALIKHILRVGHEEDYRNIIQRLEKEGFSIPKTKR